jgi:uracil-DNA glycosylase
MSAEQALEQLAIEAKACRVCIEAPLRQPLPHGPRPVFVVSAKARILIAGQAPGTRVHAAGIPFSDPSGDRLRGWLGVSPAQFYDKEKFAILPMGFCFPGLDAHGGDLPPRKECAPLWRQRFLALMPQIDLVLAIGGYAHAWHLRSNAIGKVTDTVLGWQKTLDLSPKIIPLPHPSWRNSGWLKRNFWFEEELLPVLRSEVAERIL